MNTTIRPLGSDQTQQLRDAIASAESYSVLTLDGHFHVSGDVGIRRSDLTLIGYGARLTQFSKYAKTLALYSCGNVRIIGLSLFGAGTEKPWSQESTPYNGVAGIYVSNASAVAIQDCRLTNHAGGSVVMDGRCDGIHIRGNFLRGMGESVIRPGDSGCDAAIAGTANSIKKTGLFISDNDISWHAFGLLIPGDASAIIQSNCIHDVPGQHAMYLTRGGELLVHSNQITRCALVGIKLQHQAPEHIEPLVSIHNNLVSHCGSIAIGVLTTGAGIGFTQANVSVTNNNVTRCGYPLYLRGLHDMMVAHNRASHCERALFRQDCDGTFEDNLFVQCG